MNPLAWIRAQLAAIKKRRTDALVERHRREHEAFMTTYAPRRRPGGPPAGPTP